MPLRLLFLLLWAQKRSITCPLSPTHNVTFAGIRMLKALIPKPTFPPTLCSSSGLWQGAAASLRAQPSPSPSLQLPAPRLRQARSPVDSQKSSDPPVDRAWKESRTQCLLAWCRAEAASSPGEQQQGQVSPAGRPHGDLICQWPVGSDAQNPAREWRAAVQLSHCHHSVVIKRKHRVSVIHFNRPETIPFPWFTERLSSMKLIPGTKRLGTTNLEEAKVQFQNPCDS